MGIDEAECGVPNNLADILFLCKNVDDASFVTNTILLV